MCEANIVYNLGIEDVSSYSALVYLSHRDKLYKEETLLIGEKIQEHNHFLPSAEVGWIATVLSKSSLVAIEIAASGSIVEEKN